MATNYNQLQNDYFDSLGSPSVLNKRLTWNQKSAKDFNWAKDCIKFIDGQYSCYGNKENIERIKMNYDLANGQGESAMAKVGAHMQGELIEEGFTQADMYGYIQHHPVMQIVYNSMVGEQQLRPLTPIALDLSGAGVNQRKRKRLEMCQEYIQNTILAPKLAQIQQQVFMEYSQKYQVKDPFKLNPQEQQQMQADIQGRVQQQTPKEIFSYLRKDYKGASAMEAQKILEFLMSDQEIKFITDENFKNLLIAGSEIYKVNIRHGKAVIEIVNPLGFYHMSRPNSLFIEDSVAWKYEQYVMYHDVQDWHGEEIGNSRIIREHLDLLNSGGRDRKPGDPHPQMVAEVARGNTGIIHNAPNILTREGQEYLKHTLGNLNSSGVIRQPGDIRYVHCAYKGLRKIKNIIRYNPDLDRKKSIWIDESYIFNPVKDDNGYRDIEEYIAWAPEIWEGARIDNDLFLGVGPVDYQYKSPNNPWDVKGPYVGGQYSKLMNNSKNISPMDPAKPWQYKFNLQMKHIHELEATDLGRILETPMDNMPEGFTYKKQFLMMKYGKQYIKSNTHESANPNDGIKSHDLSTDNNILNKLQYLDFLRAQIILSMNYNPSRLGLQGPTVAVTNNQQNIVQSSYQTNDIFAFHNKIVENLLNVGVDAERFALRENDSLRGFVLDDLSIADLEINWELLDECEIQVKVKNSSQEFQNVQEIKMLIQPMLQNGLLTFPDAIRAQFAKSQYEMMNLAEEAQEASQQRAQQAQQAQDEMLKRQEQLAMQMEKMKQDFELEKQRRDQLFEGTFNLQEAMIESSRFKQQKDVDENQINDDITLEYIKQEFELLKLDKEIAQQEKERQDTKELEERRFKMEKELADKKIEIEKIKARRKPASSSK